MASQMEVSQAPKMYAIFSVFFVLPLVAVGLRLLARRVANFGLWWDDWLILVAAALVIVNFAFLCETLNNGAGRHIEAIADANRVKKFQIYTFADVIIYALIITLDQSSILCLYLRIFGINRAFARIVYGFLALVTAWGIATLLTSIFKCSPVKANWITDVPNSHCMSFRRWLVGTNVPHIIIDFSILLLPLSQIWQLKLATSRKICVSAVFLVGTFTSAISIIRVIANSTIISKDPTWDYVAAMIWSTIEGNIGVICACLPTLGVLIQPLRHNRSVSAYPPSTLCHERSNRRPHRSPEFERLEEGVPGLFPKRAVLVERNIFVESDKGDQALGLDTFCVGGDGRRVK